MLDQLMILFEMLIIELEAGHQERRSPVGGRPGHNLAQVWRMVHHPAVVVPDGHHRHHLHIIVIAGIIVEENITTLLTVLPHNLLHCFALLDAKRSAFSNLPSFLSQRKELVRKKIIHNYQLWVLNTRSKHIKSINTSNSGVIY